MTQDGVFLLRRRERTNHEQTERFKSNISAIVPWFDEQLSNEKSPKLVRIFTQSHTSINVIFSSGFFVDPAELDQDTASTAKRTQKKPEIQQKPKRSSNDRNRLDTSYICLPPKMSLCCGGGMPSFCEKKTRQHAVAQIKNTPKNLRHCRQTLFAIKRKIFLVLLSTNSHVDDLPVVVPHRLVL